MIRLSFVLVLITILNHVGAYTYSTPTNEDMRYKYKIVRDEIEPWYVSFLSSIVVPNKSYTYFYGSYPNQV